MPPSSVNPVDAVHRSLPAKALLDEFLEAIPDSVYFKDRDGRFLAVAGSSEGGSWKFQVWNVLTGDLACAATENVGSGEESLEFLNPQQLLVLHNVEGTGQRRAAIWDFKKLMPKEK